MGAQKKPVGWMKQANGPWDESLPLLLLLQFGCQCVAEMGPHDGWVEGMSVRAVDAIEQERLESEGGQKKKNKLSGL
jgi:hypothetical protein